MRVAGVLGIVLVMGTFGCSEMKAAEAPRPEATMANAGEPGSKKAGDAAEAKPDGDGEPADAKPDADAAKDGNVWEEMVGDSHGAAGLGLSATGKGGGGRGEGIGLGSVGTLGHGAGTGTGQGFGSGSGRLGGNGSSGARGKVSAATATTTGGGLPADVIKRIVRQQFSQIRSCYEKAMAKDPALTGKVALKFTINGQGAVSQASAGDTTIADADMVTCLIGVMKRMSFPAPENGGTMVVTYPFQFAPGDP